MSNLPDSAHKLNLDEPRDQWLRNLDLDETTPDSILVPPTRLTIHSQGVSTPALPKEISGTEGTLTPHRFEPEPHQGSETVSD